MQLTYPGTRISTLEELFSFAECADPMHQILWNIESKINAAHSNCTKGVDEFVSRQHAIFVRSSYRHSITYQSFDWRTLVAMKACAVPFSRNLVRLTTHDSQELDANIVTSALIDECVAYLCYTLHRNLNPFAEKLHSLPMDLCPRGSPVAIWMPSLVPRTGNA